MPFWYVRHSFEYYDEQPKAKIISWRKSEAEKSPNFRTFTSMSPSDKVVWFSYESPKGIVGIFKVETVCDKKIIAGNEPSYYYEISPLFLPNEVPIDFVAKKVVGKVDGKYLRPMGAVTPLKPEQYARIKAFLLGMNEPTNHKELETLFSKVHTYLGFQKIEKHQIHYPDAIAIDSNGKEKRIEFEFYSDSFRKEGHDPKGCDIIVCWKDNLGFPRSKKPIIRELQPLYGI